MKKSMPSDIFPDRLRNAREIRDLTQSELSTRSGLQPSAISHFEAGTRKPSFENLRRLATALEVTTDYLLGRVDDPISVGKTADSVWALVEVYKNKKQQKVLITKFIRLLIVMII